ncbi:MAG: DNA polymerase III subunit delta [Spirochaetaceae bacterium]|nr:DNA polymerase III subunit delta [Spirochaetaceae bacterium]
MAKIPATIANLYLLLGPEAGEKANLINTLAATAQKTHGELDRYKFYPYDLEMTGLISLISTSSLFGGARFIVLANFEALKKPDLDNLTAALKKPQDDLYIILTSDGFKADKKLENLCPPANKRIFYELRAAERERFVESFFKKNNQVISREAIDRLLELIENQNELKVAMEALLSFYSGQDINEVMVDGLIVSSKEVSIFTLFERLALRDSSALEVLNNLALNSEGVGVQTLTGLTWQFRKLLNLKELAAGGTVSDETLRNLAIIGKKSGDLYRTALRKYSLTELKMVMVKLNEYDELLRSGLNPQLQRLALDSFVLPLVK